MPVAATDSSARALLYTKANPPVPTATASNPRMLTIPTIATLPPQTPPNPTQLRDILGATAMFGLAVAYAREVYMSHNITGYQTQPTGNHKAKIPLDKLDIAGKKTRWQICRL